jgi:glycosyltransferase involved in cell wall biosynthesis
MNILYLSPTGSLGGAERVLLTIMASIRRTRPATRLSLIACTDGPLRERAERLGVQVSVVPLPGSIARIGDSQLREKDSSRRSWSVICQALMATPQALRYINRVRQRIRELGPDLIHSNGIKTHLLAHWVRVTPAPVLWHVHDFYGSRRLVGRLLRWARGHAAGALAISEAVARDARAMLPGLPVQVLYNALDTAEFSPGRGDGEQLDRMAGLPPAARGTVRIGLVATYARWKGQQVFLEAAARLLTTTPRPTVRFYLVGGPIYQTYGSQFSEAELRNLTAALRIQGHVGFIGFQESPANVFRGLDIVVHASTRPEPFGLTIIEGMACGRPVVACRAGGAEELFRDGHDAIGVPPADVPALTAALRALVDDPERRRRLGENARRTVVLRFDSSRLGNEVLDVYDRLVPNVREPIREGSCILHSAVI